MISMPLLQRTIKATLKLWLILTIALVAMLTATFFSAKSFLDAAAIIIQQFYTLFAVVIPMIYIAVTANKLIASQVDNGSLAYVMSSPIKRNTVSLTQGLFLFGSLAAMYALITAAGLIMIPMLDGVIEVRAFLLLNLGSFLVNLAISGIAYFASCFFNSARVSMAVGAGVPVAFFLFRMLHDFSVFNKNMEIFRFFTIHTLFSVDNIMSYSSNVVWQFLVLAGISVIGYLSGIIIFKKKDLPI